jgi:hypothetical protein
MWAVGLIEAEWKGKPQEFVNTARSVLQTPPCPLLGDKNKMALQHEWYSFRSEKVKDMTVTSCSACFLKHILPSQLATSFSINQPPYSETVGCDLAHPGILAAFDAAEKEGRIAAFEQNLQKLLESGGLDETQSASSSQQSQQQGGGDLPDIDISRCRGTSQQMAALQELQQEVIAMRRVIAAESNRARAELQQAAFEQSNALTMKTAYSISGTASYANYQDGHGGWFDTRDEARASARYKMGMQQLRIAQRHNAVLAARTDELLKMKAQRTPRY